MHIYYMLKSIYKLFQKLNYQTGSQFDNSIIWKVPSYFLLNQGHHSISSDWPVLLIPVAFVAQVFISFLLIPLNNYAQRYVLCAVVCKFNMSTFPLLF